MSQSKSGSTPPPPEPPAESKSPSEPKPSMEANEKLIGRSIIGSGTAGRKH